jgi:Lar family restriction alleviation protein
VDKLKPCPFCGGKGEITRDTETIGHGSGDTVYFVKCRCCGARTKAIGALEADGTEAKKLVAAVLWEMRAEDAN